LKRKGLEALWNLKKCSIMKLAIVPKWNSHSFYFKLQNCFSWRYSVAYIKWHVLCEL